MFAYHSLQRTQFLASTLPWAAEEKTDRSCFCFKSSLNADFWPLSSLLTNGSFFLLPSSSPSFSSLIYLLFPLQAFPPCTTFLLESLSLYDMLLLPLVASPTQLPWAASADPCRYDLVTVPYILQTWEFHFGHIMEIFPPASKILRFLLLEC